MRISRVQIKNFRNFKDLDVRLSNHAVIIGENNVGKSNFLHALRLVLDPSLPDTTRYLRSTDFWDGLNDLPSDSEKCITISVELTDFEHNDDLLAVLGDYLIEYDPMVSRLTYVFCIPAKQNEIQGNKDEEKFWVYGSNRKEIPIDYGFRRHIPLEILHALRDAEGDMSSWRRSPLKPLLDDAAAQIDKQTLNDIAKEVYEATKKISTQQEIGNIAERITQRLRGMVGTGYDVNTTIGITQNDPERLVRTLRLFVGDREIGENGLGIENVLFIVLKSLHLQGLVEKTSQGRSHIFLGIEEPEAHLHPHLQRAVYRDFLKRRDHQEPSVSSEDQSNNQKTQEVLTILMTTHSPHIASVTPLDSIVLLRRISKEKEVFTKAVSTACLDFSKQERGDIERYLDVTRGELLFAKGVILVEGESEEYLVPVFGHLLGYDFDKIGISVCSIRGVHFSSYVKLLGTKGLNIPFAILTDMDPDGNNISRGIKRVEKLLYEISPELQNQQLSPDDIKDKGTEYGIFLNEDTLEIALLRSGCSKSMCDVLHNETTNQSAKERASNWKKSPDTLDEDWFLKDIKDIGKGRFAQLLCSVVPSTGCPEYIKQGIEYVIKKCVPATH